MGKFEDGHDKVGGRKKGSKNKVPSNLRDVVLSVADGLHPDGIEAAIKAWATKNPRNEGVFWTKMIAPLMPKVIETPDLRQNQDKEFEDAFERLNGAKPEVDDCEA